MKLNMGCGEYDRRSGEGWVNVDVRPEVRPDVVWDLEKTPYPWPNESAEEIIWKDALEHLSWRVIEDVLRECRRILRRGGRIYIQCPDMEDIAKRVILDPNFKFGELSGWKAISFWCMGRGDAWGGWHRAGFTIPTLKKLLEETGFVVEDIHNDGGSNIICYARKP